MSEMTELAERLRKCGEWLSLCCEAAAAIERLDHECQASMATISSERARAEAAEAEASRLRAENEKMREALEQARIWHEEQDKSLSKQISAALEGKE